MMKRLFLTFFQGVFLLGFSAFVFGQEFRNLDLSRECAESKTGLCSWDLSWGRAGAVRSDSSGGVRSIRIYAESEKAVGFTEQSAKVDRNDGIRIFTISANISSDAVEGKGAGLNVGFYDSENKLVATKDMGGTYSVAWIRGNTAWKRYSVSIICPPNASVIKIGAILYGKGTARFSDFDVKAEKVEGRKPSRLAADYIHAAYQLIRRHSLYRDGLKTDIESTALKIAGPAREFSDCFLAVEYMLDSLRPLGDDHSFFMKADEYKTWKNGGSEVNKVENPRFSKDGEYGYIFVPPFHSGDKKQSAEYAESLQNAIRELGDSGIRGWIIDLRQNTGGNMAPMIAGLGPLYSSVKLGSLVDVNGKPNSWYYEGGKYYWDDDPGMVVRNPVKLNSRLPIAVLTSGQTGSSGETVVVSFLNNEKTKSFGCPTWGLTTGNSDFGLKDGSRIFIAATIMADRTGRQLKQSIEPDFPVKDCGENETLAAAKKWLSEQR